MSSNPRPSIDITSLKKVKYYDGKIEAQCPACAEVGADNTGNHLVIFDNGKFACVANEGDHEHRKLIFNLVGIKGEKREFTAAEKREFRLRKKAEEAERVNRRKFQKLAAKGIASIREKFSWSLYDVWESSPQRIDCPLVEYDPRHFLETLFQPSDIIWTGHTWQSGACGQDRFHTPLRWKEKTLNEVGPMTSPASWNPGITSRCSANVKSAPYVVLDFDELEGRYPETEKDRRALISHALAVTNWLVTEHGVGLAAIVHTGNKSLHVWIKSITIKIKEIRGIARLLGIDPGLIGHPHHPCRLPGQSHNKSENQSRVLWLKT